MTTILRRSLGGAALGLLLSTTLAFGQTFPSKHVMLMVPYPAGGPADALARIISEPLGQALGQSVLVDNLGGAGGVLGAQKVLAEPADGHFLLQASPNEVILAPALNSAVKLKADDFRLVHPIARGVLVLVTRKDLQVRDADELIALAKRADKPLTYGSVGQGSLNHLIMEQVQKETNTRFVHVPYKGSAPLLQDLGGGQIDVAVLVYSASLGGLVDKGVMQVIGQFGAQRSPLQRNVPAVNEGTQLKRLSFTTWSGVMVRRNTPEAVVQRLHKSLTTAIQTPQVRDALAAQSLEVASPMPLDSAAKFFQSEIDSYRTMLGTIDVKIQ